MTTHGKYYKADAATVEADKLVTLEEALEKIKAMAESDITCVEQPVAADDLEGLGWLAERRAEVGE